MRSEPITEEELVCKSGEVVCINLSTMDIQKWDHHQLIGLGLPDGYIEYNDLSCIELLNYILKSKKEIE